MPPHYVRETSKREYLELGLSTPIMYKHYKEWCVTESLPATAIATLHQYRTVMNTEFNIGFFKPKKDQCQLCNLMKKGTREEKEKFKDKWISHIKNKDAARKEKSGAKTLAATREDVGVCVFDLQKVLPCPKSETCIFFYKNKLSLYNLTVYDMIQHQGICYLWHEGVAKRGANEVGSALLDFISLCVKKGLKEIRSFSDSCSGQNKNRYIYGMLLSAAAKHSIKIRHCFLEPGHTQNEGDSVHARIECAAKGRDIFDMDEWINLIKSAKQTYPPYEVKLLKRNAVFDLHDLVSKQNWEKDSEGRKITWNKIRVVEADFSKEGVLGFKYDFGEEMFYLHTNQRRGHPMNLKTYIAPLAYLSKIPLKKKTVEHLEELCTKLAIPSKYHECYRLVISDVEPTDSEIHEDPVVEDDSVNPDDALIPETISQQIQSDQEDIEVGSDEDVADED